MFTGEQERATDKDFEFMQASLSSEKLKYRVGLFFRRRGGE